MCLIICVVGSPILWAAIIPTISPGATIEDLYTRMIVSIRICKAFLLKRLIESRYLGER